MTGAPGQQILEFAGFRLDLPRRTLAGPDGRLINLKPRVFDTLAALAARPGQLVTRQELMDAVWPNLVVEENNLNQAIAALRRELGESADGNSLIATVPGRGYQLVVAPGPAPEPASAPGVSLRADAMPPRVDGVVHSRTPLHRVFARPLWTGLLILFAALVAGSGFWMYRGGETASPPYASIAVLPFLNLSSDPEQEYLSDGLAEEILNELAQIQQLHVIARTSSFQFKGQSPDARTVGRALNATHILEGSVRRSGSALRVTAKLIDASSGAEQWSETFDRKLDDIFILQQEIAGAVARELRVALRLAPTGTGSAGTTDVAAYDHYLRAMALMSRNNEPAIQGAIAELDRALGLDPGYGVAWAALADAHFHLAIYHPDRAASQLSLRDTALQHALTTAPDRQEVQLQHAEYLITRRDWTGAANALATAKSVSPADTADWLATNGSLLASTGRTAESLGFYLKARELNPLSLDLSIGVSWALDVNGRPREAASEYLRILKLGISGNAGGPLHLARLLRLGDSQAVRTFLEGFPDERPGRQTFARSFATAWTDRNEALKLLRSLLTNPDFAGPNSLPGFAAIAGHYGDTSLALDLLREDFVVRGGHFTAHLWSVDLPQMRRTPEFKELVRAVGLVDYWRVSGNWGDYCRPVGEDDFECR